ncbi:MerR family DNA-binding transcriptional regulator [Argonema antarcticum]|uniref:MerR family DNA-binding transcriptional regulator n=1 Tax=Argonema antarcticum TaxID=2942763 RepID=UPI0020138F74|nr:MerR family DNA-binding transcriptional regulator [Argonema antarcticum]MCL1475881.1 hypothetical protein [Argonema antarcticum A004/B2]
MSSLTPQEAALLLGVTVKTLHRWQLDGKIKSTRTAGGSFKAMTTLTYCKGLPTPIDELTPLGLTSFELFLADLAALSYNATIETVNHLLKLESQFAQSKWNTYLQKKYRNFVVKTSALTL